MKRQEQSNKEAAYICLHDYRNCCSYKTVSAVYISTNEKIQKFQIKKRRSVWEWQSKFFYKSLKIPPKYFVRFSTLLKTTWRLFCEESYHRVWALFKSELLKYLQFIWLYTSCPIVFLQIFVSFPKHWFSSRSEARGKVGSSD